jgi:MFS family permease
MIWSSRPARLAMPRAILEPRNFSLQDQVYVSLLWFAFYAQWMTVVPIIAPDQVATILGADAATKEGISGTILAAGAVVALITAPVAGALSDRLRNPSGRRRPFLITGTAATCIALTLLIPFRPGSSIFLYALVLLNLQLWWNWAAGPYAGLIPDVVPESDQGSASAWMNIMSILGTIVGNGITAALYTHGRPAAAVAAFITVNIACLVLTLRKVHEPPAAGDDHPLALAPFLRSFWLNPRMHRNFYWVLLTRLLGNMGVWSVFTFLLYYLQDVIGLAEPGKILPTLLGAGAILAIPASLIGVRLADRFGTVATVQATGWVMAGASICYVLLAFHPRIALVIPVMLVFAAGYGAYQAVDWALALKVLPTRDTAGKDMGIWHISMVLPQILGPAGTGWLITAIKTAGSARLAYAVAFVVAALWFTLAATLVARVRLPMQAESPGVAA